MNGTMNDGFTPAKGLLLVLSGPAGVGKDTVWKTASPCLPTFAKAITCTTRAQRPGEVDGIHYYFVSKEEFERRIADHELLEWAEVHGNLYGVPVSSVTKRLNAGGDVVCIIEVQGALKIRHIFEDDALLVFLKPPPGREEEILRQRILNRGAEDDAQIKTRMETAAWEMEQKEHYDFEIVNDEIEHAADELCRVIKAEKHKREAQNAKR
jgi:guanylate kinase